MNDIYQNCRIENVIWSDGMPVLTFDVLNDNGHIETINIQNRNVKDQIQELLNHKRERTVLAFGMTDIDIWQSDNNQFRIEQSPIPGVYINMMVDATELEKLIH